MQSTCRGGEIGGLAGRGIADEQSKDAEGGRVADSA